MGAAIALSAEFCSFMATNQLIAGLLAGAFGYEPMKKLLGKVKGLK